MRRTFLRWALCLALGSGGLLFAAYAVALVPLLVGGLTFADMTIGATLTNWIVGVGTVVTGVIFTQNCGQSTNVIFDCDSTAPRTIEQAVSQSLAGAKPIQVKLNPDSKRVNPNPVKWDDPAASARDVTSKTTYKLAMDYATKPGNGSLAAIAGGSVGVTKYANSDGTTATEADVIDISGYSGSDALKDSAAKAATSGSHSGWSWSCCYVQQSGVGATRALWYRTVSMSCDAGYTKQADGSCLKTDDGAVKKPDTTPCEVLYDGTTGKFSYDAKNPNCAGVQSKLEPSGDGTIRFSQTDGQGNTQGIEAKKNAKGGWDITKDNGPTKGSTTVKTGPYSPTAGGGGGYPVEETVNKPGGDLTGGGSGTGGTGTGTTGSGTGDCSSYGCAKESTQLQVRDAVQDITKPMDGTAFAAIQAQFKSDRDAAAQALLTDVQSKFKTAADYNGITSHIASSLGFPPGGQCSNAVFNFDFMGRVMVVDFQWMCVPIAPIVNWFFWMLVLLAGISEVLYILTGRGLPGEYGSVAAGERIV